METLKWAVDRRYEPRQPERLTVRLRPECQAKRHFAGFALQISQRQTTPRNCSPLYLRRCFHSLEFRSHHTR